MNPTSDESTERAEALLTQVERLLEPSERIRARVIDEATMPLGGGVADGDLLLLDRYLCRLGVE